MNSVRGAVTMHVLAAWDVGGAPGETGECWLFIEEREPGAALDTIVLQLADLPAPTGTDSESDRTPEGVFLERNGRVVAEAEHFSVRTPQSSSNATWRIVPDEQAGDVVHLNRSYAVCCSAIAKLSNEIPSASPNRSVILYK